MLALGDLTVLLYLRRVISSYLMDQTLLYDIDDGTHSYKITGGMPQDSVLGSPIWNVLYDGLLRQPLPDGVSMIAYADDVALVVAAKSIEEVQYLGDIAIEVIGDCLNDHELSLVAEKTEAVLIVRLKKKANVTYTVINKKIRTGDTIIYLGATIDALLSFKDHLRNAGLKASKVARALSDIMPNIRSTCILGYKWVCWLTRAILSSYI